MTKGSSPQKPVRVVGRSMQMEVIVKKLADEQHHRSSGSLKSKKQIRGAAVSMMKHDVQKRRETSKQSEYAQCTLTVMGGKLKT